MKNSGPTLTLKKIQELGFGSKAGQYACGATNDKTKRAAASAAVSFAVMGECPPALTCEDVLGPVGVGSVLLGSGRPRFGDISVLAIVSGGITGVRVSGPTAVLLAGNSSANLSCGADAGKVQTVTWKKDGQSLTEGGRVRFAKDARSVVIEPVLKEDNGEFTCQLGNAVSNEQAAYKMVVNCECLHQRRRSGRGLAARGAGLALKWAKNQDVKVICRFSPDGPEEPKVSGEKAVEINDKVMLTCSAPSVPPANFTWRFNGTVTDVTTATYVIDKAVYKNTGTYTCEAHNAVTGERGQVTHSLSVKGKARPQPRPRRRKLAGWCSRTL